MGRQTTLDVAAGGGSVVVVGRDKKRVDETVAELSGSTQAWASPPTWPTGTRWSRCRSSWRPAHADATLLVNAVGFFIPKAFLDYDGADYDSYLEPVRPADHRRRP